MSGQAIFRYNTPGVDNEALARFVEKLAEATGHYCEPSIVCQTGDSEFFLWDSAHRLFLTEEPVCGVLAPWNAILADGRSESFGNVARWFPSVGPHGLSLEDIRQAAGRSGLTVEAVKSKKNGLLNHLKSGGKAILHIAPHHFAAAVGLSEEGVLVADYPSVQLTKWSDLEKQWPGNALFVAATRERSAGPQANPAAVVAIVAMAVLIALAGVLVIQKRRRERSD